MLAAIAQVLGEHGISIASVIQHDPGDDAPEHSPVPLVIMTHMAVEAELRAALAEIDALERGPRAERLPGGRGMSRRRTAESNRDVTAMTTAFAWIDVAVTRRDR